MIKVLFILNLAALLVFLVTKTICSIEYLLLELKTEKKKELRKIDHLTEEEYRNYIL